MDGLALGEHVRVLLVRGLSRRHPLERSAFVGSCNLDLNIDSFAFGNLGRECDSERTAIWFKSVAHVELDTLAVDLYDRDVQKAGIC